MTTDVLTGNTYDKYGSNNPVERKLMGGFFEALMSSLPDTVPEAILEVGVGEGEVSGRLSARYPEATIVGVDLPDPELEAHWRARGLNGLCADIVQLPFPSKSFDLVMGIEVLEHVPDPARGAGRAGTAQPQRHRPVGPARADLADREPGPGQVHPRPGQHSRPRAALVEEGVRRDGRDPVRRRRREVTLPVDDGHGPHPLSADVLQWSSPR